MNTPRELKALYGQGKNITQLLREQMGVKRNTDELIELVYDLQTGSYIAAMDIPEKKEIYDMYTAELVSTIRSLCSPASILEAGIGEATTLSYLLNDLGVEVSGFGFDISWSRVAYARRWLHRQGLADTMLCTGNLTRIPFADNSVDLVYTSHSIESNGGNEKPILEELYRVTREFLILLEPGYEFASDEGKRRMDSFGYCRDLKDIALSLGYEVLRHELFSVITKPINPTAITIIRKKRDSVPPAHILACPRFKTPLEKIGNMMFSPEALVVYPIVGGIPCLRIENGILASKYKEIAEVGEGNS